MQVVARRTSLLLAAAFLSLGACTGTLETTGEGVGSGVAGGPGQMGGAPGGSGPTGRPTGGAGGSGPPSACAGADPGPSPLRRLTPAEYRNTVRDLFRAADLPAVTIAEDQTVKGFGFNNNADVQTPAALLLSQYQRAAVDLVDAAFKRPDRFLPCQPKDAAAEAACGAQIVDVFGARAFRRPLTADEGKQFRDFFEAARKTDNFSVAAQLTIGAMLQSPPFLYRIETGAAKGADGTLALAPYEIASRLSYLLWNSMPDDELFAAAKDGKLATPADVEKQARRMLADPKAKAAVAEFHAQWLESGAIDGLTKEKAAFPKWSDELRTGLRIEAERAVERAVFEPKVGYLSLLSSTKTFVNGPLADLYGVPRPASAAGGWVDLDPGKRAGLVTQAFWLASHAHPIHPSPVKRGQFVMAKLLCTPPPSPPGDVNTAVPTMPTADARTNRQRLDRLHNTKPECRACHKAIDGIGFGLEGYDAAGAFRTTDNGVPVDDSGEIAVGSDVDGPFKGGVELAGKLAKSQTVRACVATQWFRFAMGRPVDAAADRCTLQAMEEAFAASGHDVKEMLVALAKSTTFRARRGAAQ